MAQQIDGLSQQAATFVAGNETLQAEEMAQLQRINVMQGQIDTLSQQTASFASTEAVAAVSQRLAEAAERLTTEEDAQSARLAALAQQIDGLSQQAATFVAGNETLQAEEMAQLQRINVMQGQIDTLSQQTASFASTEAVAAVSQRLAEAAERLTTEEGAQSAQLADLGAADRRPEPAGCDLCR